MSIDTEERDVEAGLGNISSTAKYKRAAYLILDARKDVAPHLWEFCDRTEDLLEMDGETTVNSSRRSRFLTRALFLIFLVIMIFDTVTDVWLITIPPDRQMNFAEILSLAVPVVGLMLSWPLVPMYFCAIKTGRCSPNLKLNCLRYEVFHAVFESIPQVFLYLYYYLARKNVDNASIFSWVTEDEYILGYLDFLAILASCLFVIIPLINYFTFPEAREKIVFRSFRIGCLVMIVMVLEALNLHKHLFDPCSSIDESQLSNRTDECVAAPCAYVVNGSATYFYSPESVSVYSLSVPHSIENVQISKLLFQLYCSAWVVVFFSLLVPLLHRIWHKTELSDYAPHLTEIIVFLMYFVIRGFTVDSQGYNGEYVWIRRAILFIFLIHLSHFLFFGPIDKYFEWVDSLNESEIIDDQRPLMPYHSQDTVNDCVSIASDPVSVADGTTSVPVPTPDRICFREELWFPTLMLIPLLLSKICENYLL